MFGLLCNGPFDSRKRNLSFQCKLLFIVFLFLGTANSTLLGQEHEIKTVRFVLEGQLDLKNFRDSLIQNKVPVAMRPQLLVQRLQATYNPIQEQFRQIVLNFEKEQPGSVGKLHFNFLVNLATIEVSGELHQYLLQSGLVKEELDERMRPVYLPPVDRITDISRQIGGHEPGHSAIKAPFMWNLGYTGAGRVIYIIDTGVWTTHPALKRQWSGNYFPLDWSWRSYDRPLPGDKAESHGTHVTGTCLGLDTLTHDTVGLAFNARFIASDPIAESVAGIKPIEVLVGAFEFALNPDGDINTSDDVPDVITNSWGIPYFEASLCNSTLISDMFLALESAGIAVEFSAGNEGPEPESISMPQYISIDTLSIFSVGAIDASTENSTHLVTSFSSRGPSKCISEGALPALRIKPEVVAPGFTVRSSVDQDQYAYYSGTSMAGPHVSGGVALLKEAFPLADGREILNALYQTATDLGVPGEDNDYGRGLINLEGAYHFLAQSYSPKAPNTSQYDLSIEQIVLPKAACLGSTTLDVVLQNRGTAPIGAEKLVLRNNMSQIQEKVLKQTLQPGEQLVVTFSDVLLNNSKHEFYATVYADSQLVERNQVNNNCTRQLQVASSLSMPYKEDFEKTSIAGNGRILLNADQKITWDTIATAGLSGSHRSAIMQFIGYTPRNGQIDELQLPLLQIPVGAKKMVFRCDYAYRYRNGYNDSLRIDVSTDCGQTWPVNLIKTGGKSLATTDTSWTHFVPQKANDWDSLYFQLDSLVDVGAVMFRIQAINRGGSKLYLDNINVYTDIIPQDTLFADWEVFPNPATSTLNVYSNNPLKDASVFISDLNGRVVYQTKIADGTTLVEIPMNGLAAGLYLIRLEAERGPLIKKFLRQ